VQARALPSSENTLQPFDGGQAPAHAAGSAAKSQLSTGDSTTPLPQTGAQSGSTPKCPPDGQQPSPGTNAVMGRNTHAAWQVPADTRRSAVHESPSEQCVGHALGPLVMAVSHSSPAWLLTTPSPQVALQSASVDAMQPLGQQPSFTSEHAVTSWTVQLALQ
jgi:hypothetical protein